jgi:gamma-glutamyltranspeptidase/glutathione hydrolase
MAAAVKKLGGPLAAEDLAAWSGPTWVRPIRSSFRGVDVFEMPPPGQGIVVLEAMRIYESLDATSWSEADHLLVESLKVAFDDASDVVADPDFETVPVDVLLSDAHRDAVAARVTGQAAGSRAPGQASDTVYVAVVDGSGSACSLIQSLYEGFGSGILVEGTGLMLHNRGNGFTLRDGHPNRPEGGKRPYHTIIPAMLGDGGRFLGCLGIVGGFMQPQGQLQILRNLIDRGMSPQEAVDAARFRVLGDGVLGLEPEYDPEIAGDLSARGHRLTALPRFDYGGAQVIMRTVDGLEGGSDRRKDGHVGTVD